MTKHALLRHAPGDAAFQHSNTGISVEGTFIIATAMAIRDHHGGNGLDGIAATGRGLLLNTNREVAVTRVVPSPKKQHANRKASDVCVTMGVAWIDYFEFGAGSTSVSNRLPVRRAGAAKCLSSPRMMRRLRAMECTGPPLPTGVTPQTMAEANRGTQQAFGDDNRSWHAQSQRQSQVQHNYAMQGSPPRDMVGAWHRPYHYSRRRLVAAMIRR